MMQISGRSAWHGSVRADRIWDPGPGGRDVFEPGERPKAMQDVIRQEDPEQTNRDNSGNLTGLELSAESAVIMEASGGQVLLEKMRMRKRPLASVTKVVMTPLDL